MSEYSNERYYSEVMNLLEMGLVASQEQALALLARDYLMYRNARVLLFDQTDPTYGQIGFTMQEGDQPDTLMTVLISERIVTVSLIRTAKKGKNDHYTRELWDGLDTKGRLREILDILGFIIRVSG